MIVALLFMSVVTVVFIIALYRRLDARFVAISRGLIRIENALGAREWLELAESEAGTPLDWIDSDGIIGRLDRIETAVDPMARARHQARRVMSELDEALQRDERMAYQHFQVSKILELVEQGERPEQADWDSWIKTPFPWA
jgi:hypothetical protein